MKDPGTALRTYPRLAPGNFFVPRRFARVPRRYEELGVCAIIPTHAPDALTLRLVLDLLRWNEKLHVLVVDDCSPRERDNTHFFKKVAAIPNRVTLLRTPENRLKASALNFALTHIQEHFTHLPDVVVTLDDDVVIAQETVQVLVRGLMDSPHLGAVCSQCRVYNKNENLLTRLQGLEYLGFNAIRLADEGFINGPLVMHGMLAAFRAEALLAVGGFAEGHLIEDYEITMRLKERGWHVRSVQEAPAWTRVPSTLRGLWRQRTRWSYGGITVVSAARSPLSVFQDILGHTLFLSMLALIGVLFFSRGEGHVPPYLAELVITIALVQLGISYAFQLWLMRLYKEKDVLDWLLRLSLVPEFAYSYLMTFALLGSYVFHFFVVCKRPRGRRGLAVAIENLFRTLGYAERQWGTRATHTI